MASQGFLGAGRSAAAPCGTANTSSSTPVMHAVHQRRPVLLAQSLLHDTTSPCSTSAPAPVQGHVLNARTSRLLRRTLKTARSHLTETQAIAMRAPQAASLSLEAELLRLSARLKHLGIVPDQLLSSTDELDWEQHLTASSAIATVTSRSMQHAHAATTTPSHARHHRSATHPHASPAMPSTPSTSGSLDMVTAAATQLPLCVQGRVLVCQGSKCQAAGSMQTLRMASAMAAGTGIEVLPSKCLGKCKLAPAVRVQGPETLAQPVPARGGDKRGVLYTQVTPELLIEAMQQHCRTAGAANGPQMLPF